MKKRMPAIFASPCILFPFCSACDDSVVFGIKIHDTAHAEELGCTFEKVVFILRNPYHSILSEFNRKFGKSHTGVAAESTFENDGKQ